MSLRLVRRSIWANPGNRGRRLRKTLEAVGWQLRKRILRRPRVLTLRSGARFIAHPDCVISSALVYADWPEFREIDFVRARLAPNAAIVDVGACVGHLPLLLADVVDPRRIFAFEPTPVSHCRLVANWRVNGWPTEQLYRVAVGAVSETVFIEDTPSPTSTNQVHRTPGAGLTAVPQITLDEFAASHEVGSVGLLKVDVEGQELDVLRGARRFLEHTRPRMVLFESLGGRLDAGIRSVLEDAGYRVFGLDDRGRPDATRLDRQNLFAMAESDP